MLLFHKLLTYSPSISLNLSGAEQKSNKNFIDFLRKSDVRCFEVGEINLTDEMREKVKNFLIKNELRGFLPFPIVAIHFYNSLLRVNSVAIVQKCEDRLSSDIFCSPSSGLMLSNLTIFSYCSYIEQYLGESSDVAEELEERMSVDLMVYFYYGIIFNKFDYRKPDFSGQSRQVRRSMGIKKVSDVIHIYPKEARSSDVFIKKVMGIREEVSYRFDRAGHFRKIKGVGRDSDGNYGLRGMTWVKAHVVGSEDKPYMPKTRVYHYKNQN